MSSSVDYGFYFRPCAIASGQNSEVIDLKGTLLVGLRTPASLASTALTIQSSDSEAGTFTTLKNISNANISITVDSNAAQYALDPNVFAGIRFIRIVAGTSETAKTFTLISRKL